jgi:hypothetical protein
MDCAPWALASPLNDWRESESEACGVAEGRETGLCNEASTKLGTKVVTFVEDFATCP